MKRSALILGAALVAAIGIQTALPRTAFGWGSWRSGDPAGSANTWGQQERGEVATISWQDPTEEMFKQARDKSQVMVLYFGNRLRTSEWLGETDLGELAKAEAVIGIRVTRPEESTAFTQTRVPQSRLTAADLWSAFGVKEADVFVVTDKFGNEYRRTTSKELAEVVKSTGKHFREVRLAVKEMTEAATKARDDGKLAEAIAALHKAFKKDLVGYAEAEAANKLYADILFAGRKQLAEAGTDMAKLTDLGKTYAGTDLEAEVAQAIKKAGGKG